MKQNTLEYLRVTLLLAIAIKQLAVYVLLIMLHKNCFKLLQYSAATDVSMAVVTRSSCFIMTVLFACSLCPCLTIKVSPPPPPPPR
jgi:hypothetical protein